MALFRPQPTPLHARSRKGGKFLSLVPSHPFGFREIVMPDIHVSSSSHVLHLPICRGMCFVYNAKAIKCYWRIDLNMYIELQICFLTRATD